MEAVQQAESGHPAMPIDMADIATVQLIVEQAANEEGLVRRTSIQAGAAAHFTVDTGSNKAFGQNGAEQEMIDAQPA